LRLHVSNAYAKAPQYYTYIILFIEMVASFQYYCTYCRQHDTLLRLSSATCFVPSYESSSRYKHCSRYKYEWKWTFGICGVTDSKIFAFTHTCVLNSVFHVWRRSMRSAGTCSSIDKRNKVLLCSRAVYSNIKCMSCFYIIAFRKRGPFSPSRGVMGGFQPRGHQTTTLHSPPPLPLGGEKTQSWLTP
jgi:hypothetical protein